MAPEKLHRKNGTWKNWNFANLEKNGTWDWKKWHSANLEKICTSEGVASHILGLTARHNSLGV